MVRYYEDDLEAFKSDTSALFIPVHLLSYALNVFLTCILQKNNKKGNVCILHVLLAVSCTSRPRRLNDDAPTLQCKQFPRCLRYTFHIRTYQFFTLNWSRVAQMKFMVMFLYFY